LGGVGHQNVLICSLNMVMKKKKKKTTKKRRQQFNLKKKT